MCFLNVTHHLLVYVDDVNILKMFFWVFPRRQFVVGRRFGTLYRFHLQRLVVDWKPLLHTLKEKRDKHTAHNNLTAT